MKWDVVHLGVASNQKQRPWRNDGRPMGGWNASGQDILDRRGHGRDGGRESQAERAPR